MTSFLAGQKVIELLKKLRYDWAKNIVSKTVHTPLGAIIYLPFAFINLILRRRKNREHIDFIIQ